MDKGVKMVPEMWVGQVQVCWSCGDVVSLCSNHLKVMAYAKVG